jgi:hypothetical protein
MPVKGEEPTYRVDERLRFFSASRLDAQYMYMVCSHIPAPREKASERDQGHRLGGSSRDYSYPAIPQGGDRKERILAEAEGLVPVVASP